MTRPETHAKMKKMQCTAFRQTALTGLTFLVMVLRGTPAGAVLRDDAVAYRTQGYEAQQRGDRSGAISWYQKAAALDPLYPAPHNDLGVVLEEEGRLEDAQHAYERALALDPQFAEAHSNLALLAERRGDKEQAVSHWLKRYQLGPSTDLWAVKAKERLIALGALSKEAQPQAPSTPELPAVVEVLPQPQSLVHQEFEAHEQSRREFYAVTEAQGDWAQFRQTR